MNIPKLDWYGRNELLSEQPTPAETITEIEPSITTETESVAKDVPEYPATETQADELETTEIVDDGDKVIEEGEG